ncbi:hypothetical protein F0562_023555 [Nyssa sinensis]|uniref:DFDF domain-containing protein n=1 Tax=Nyssa sinensis TaxID=561372 RepID=A0A5J5BHT9_9ASTE|nr:hypothetical protein F0562_023555 [Nyssa sinensis]
MPAYWPGSSGSSGGVSHLQQLPPSQGLAVSPPVQQQIQYPTTNAPLPGAASNFAEFSLPLLPTVCTGFSSSTSTVPPFALPSNFPIGQSTVLSSNLSPNLMPTNAPNANPTAALGSSSLLVSPLTSSSLNVNPVVPPIVEKPRSIFGPALPYQTIAQSMPSIVEPSNATHNEASIPPLATPGQLLQPGATTPSSSQSLQTSQKDIEIVQASTSESVSSDPKNAQEPAQQLPSSSATKVNGDSLQSHQSNRRHAQGRGNGQGGAALHTHHSSWGHVRGRGNGLNGAALRTDYNYRGHARGTGNGLNGAGLHPHHSNRGPSWGRENGLNGAGLHPHYSNRGPWGIENGPIGAALHTYRRDRGRGRGRGTQVSPTVTKFTEDFDFEAMNEKFNKVEVWGRLGKTNKIRLEDEEGDENDSDGDDGKYEEEDGLPKFDAKPFYVKDDFFDSLSCHTLDRESGRGRAKLSEQKRIDTETFGEFQGHRQWSWQPGAWAGWVVKGLLSWKGKWLLCWKGPRTDCLGSCHLASFCCP